ncbi:MAG: SigB/SigF/SigG family RNA polymerase sigma factor [Gaiellaceae bacterium]
MRSRELEREKRLLQRYARFSDPAARSELARRFLPLARGLAMRYARSGEPLDDLVQVACVGLLKAIDRFDPECGNEFSSFAVPTITGELRRYFRDCGWSLHLPRGEQDRLLSVRRHARELTGTLGRPPSPREIADAAGLALEDVLDALEAETATRPASLDAEIASAEAPTSRSNWLGREDDGFEFVESRAAAAHALRRLAPRDHQILYMRFFQDMRQAEIAERLGVSQMHVSRLLRAALERSRALASEPPSADGP